MTQRTRKLTSQDRGQTITVVCVDGDPTWKGVTFTGTYEGQLYNQRKGHVGIRVEGIQRVITTKHWLVVEEV